MPPCRAALRPCRPRPSASGPVQCRPDSAEGLWGPSCPLPCSVWTHPARDPLMGAHVPAPTQLGVEPAGGGLGQPGFFTSDKWYHYWQVAPSALRLLPGVPEDPSLAPARVPAGTLGCSASGGDEGLCRVRPAPGGVGCQRRPLGPQDASAPCQAPCPSRRLPRARGEPGSRGVGSCPLKALWPGRAFILLSSSWAYTDFI